MPKLGIAPRLPRPQRGVLLLDYFGMWRIRVSIPVLNLAKVVCYHVQQSPCVHRDSNPNLNLGRVKYYPCTMDAHVLQTPHQFESFKYGQKTEKQKIREGRFELPTKGSLRTHTHTLQSSALPLSYPRCAPCIPPV